MEDEVGQPGLLQRGPEGVDELVGQLADEADGVGEQVVAPARAQNPRRRVQRVEEPVADAGGGAGERVEQRRLAGVGVAGQGDRGQVRALALGAHHRAAGAHPGQAALEGRDAVAGQAAVGLDLGLTRAAGADAAAEALQVRPQPAHAGEVVLQLGELDLELALGAVGVGGEDVEDDRGAVDDRHAEGLLEVALLARGELVVTGHEVGVGAPELGLDLLELAASRGTCWGAGCSRRWTSSPTAATPEVRSSSRSSVSSPVSPSGTAAMRNARWRARPWARCPLAAGATMSVLAVLHSDDGSPGSFPRTGFVSCGVLRTATAGAWAGLAGPA